MVNYTISEITKKQCESILSGNHYLSKQGFSFRSGYNYGLFDGEKLIGAAVFHTVSAWQTVKGCFGLPDKEQQGFWELGRFVLDEKYHQKNLASWFLARAIKLFRKETEVRALISYADSDYHIGTIYQALGFTYHGLTAQKSDFWAEQSDGSYKKISRGKTAGVRGIRKPRSRKHRYLMVFDETLTTLWKQEKYPKK